MKKVFTHENRLIVYNIKNLLQEQGIECLVKNEFAGGGVGDLAPFETWPELWVTQKKNYEQAAELIEQSLNPSQVPESWCCSHCHEMNEGQFQLCWKCSNPRNLKDIFPK